MVVFSGVFSRYTMYIATTNRFIKVTPNFLSYCIILVKGGRSQIMFLILSVKEEMLVVWLISGLAILLCMPFPCMILLIISVIYT